MDGEGTGERPAWLGLVEERRGFLARLAEAPAHKPTLVEALECSRSTVDRAIRRLTAAGLVERTPDGYRTTTTGRTALEHHRRYVADQRAVEAASPLLAAIPDTDPPPPGLLADATVTTAEEGRPLERLAGDLRVATSYRAALPRVTDSRHLRLLHARVLEDDLSAELVLDPALADRLREEFPALVGDLLGAGSCTLLQGSIPPYGLALTTARGARTASLLAYDGASLAGLLRSGADRALEAAETGLDRATATGEVVPEPAAGDTAATPAVRGADGDRRPRTRAGLTRVDRSYFTERTPGDPETAWRLGFELVDVYYGYPTDRTDPSLVPSGPEEGAEGPGEAGRPTVAGALVDRLADGEDHVVVGPPGAGKSTVCRQVVCGWVDGGHGPVYHRDGPRPGGAEDQGPSPDTVLESVRPADTDSRALVVVEDAAGGSLGWLLRFVRRARDEPTVAVLLEARESDWDGAVETLTDPRLRETAREHLSTYRLPAVDVDTCRRAVTAFEAATGQSVPVSPSALLERVSNDGGPGEMHVLGHQVVAHATPWIEAGADRSALAADVRATYEAVTDRADGDPAGDPLAPTVAVLVATLTAAEWPVTPGLVHAVAAARSEAESGSESEDADPGGLRDDGAHRRLERVLDRLEGRMFVRRGEGPTYRTQHPLWAVRFLEHALERTERETVALFERGVNAVLALADEPARRRRVETWLGRDAPSVAALAEPEAVGELVAALFGVGLAHARLAPLFGTTEHSGLVLPATCPPAAELEARSCRGKMWLDSGDRERAADELRALCAATETVDCEVGPRTRYRAEANRLLGETVIDDAATDRARDRLERSLAAARRGEHPRHEVGALNSLAWVAMTVDDYERALEHLETALTVAETAGIETTVPHATTRYYMAKLHRYRGDLAAAEEWLTRTIELDRELGNRRNVSYSRKLLGDVARDRGALDEAADHYRRSLELKREVGDRSGTAATLCALGDVHRERGALDRAEAVLERGLEIAREDDLERHLGRLHGALGRLALARDRPERATEHLETQRERHAAIDNDRGVASATAGLGDVARSRGATEEARERYRAAVERYRTVGDRRATLETITDLVETCLAADEEGAAASWCRTGLEVVAEVETAETGDLADRRDHLAETLATIEGPTGTDVEG